MIDIRDGFKAAAVGIWRYRKADIKVKYDRWQRMVTNPLDMRIRRLTESGRLPASLTVLRDPALVFDKVIEALAKLEEDGKVSWDTYNHFMWTSRPTMIRYFTLFSVFTRSEQKTIHFVLNRTKTDLKEILIAQLTEGDITGGEDTHTRTIILKHEQIGVIHKKRGAWIMET